MIQDYLLELLEELRLPSRRRRRVLAEVDDHLTCAAANLLDQGLGAVDAEREAIRRFGAARPLAQDLMEQEMVRTSRQAGTACSLLALAFAVVVLGPTGKALPWTSGNFPAGVLALALGQVALVAGLITFIRALVAGTQPHGHRTCAVLILRGVAVVLGAMAILALAGVGTALSSLLRGMSPWNTQDWLVLSGMVASTCFGGALLWRARRRAMALKDSGMNANAGLLQADPLVELRHVAHVALRRMRRRAPLTARRVETLARGALVLALRRSHRLSRLGGWLDLARHPYRFASALALIAGLSLAVVHAVTDGGLGAPHPELALLAGALITGVEALLALIGYLLLGRVLGLRADAQNGSGLPRADAA